MKKYAYVIIVAVAAVAVVLVMQARSPKPTTRVTDPHAGMQMSGGQEAAYSGKVLETMNSGGYTYVYVDTGKEKIWAAGPETEIEVGDQVAFPAGMEMRDFKSESLDREFDMVLFVSQLIRGGVATAQAAPVHPPVTSAKTAAEGMDFSGIELPSGGERIENLYADKSKLAGKEVIVRGKVIKVTSGVMGKNWLHIMDGTGKDATADLVVTTDAEVNVGDLVLVKGKMTTDRDFGMGYSYEILVEDADVTVE